MSVLSPSVVKASQGDLVMHVFRLQGAATSALSLVEPESGGGVTVARTGVGVHTLTFTDSPGNYVGFSWGLEDATPANVHDHQPTVDNYTSKVLTFTVTDQAGGTPALADLAATSFLTLVLFFKQTGV